MTPNNAAASCNGITGDICTVQCQGGYEVSPAGSQLTCADDGSGAGSVTWTGDSSCTPVECLPQLTDPADGNVQVIKYVHKQSATRTRDFMNF